MGMGMGMGMGTRVSLVITTRNRPKYLAEAIDSVLAQTHPNWELIVWDDGSTDPIYVPNDRRIKLVCAPHSGRQIALKSAIDLTSADYLGWVDDDDILDPEALAQTLSVLIDNPQVGMVYTNHSLINQHGENLGLGARCRIPYSPGRLLVDFMTHHFRVIRRDVYNLIGGVDVEFARVEDYDFSLKVSEVTQIYHLKQDLYRYRVHPQMRSSQRREQQREYAYLAINNALKRRGMAETHRLVRTNRRFRIEEV
jgi:glycosyltransferase involved in cell wall biosynthesis